MVFCISFLYQIRLSLVFFLIFKYIEPLDYFCEAAIMELSSINAKTILFFLFFRIPGEPGSAGLPGLAGKDGWRGQPGVSGQKVGHGPLYISNIIQ